MKKIIIASLMATLLGTTALADTSSMNADVAGMGILENNWVRAGINGTTGTFGSGGGTTPGLLFDPTGTGTFDPSYDYLTPGSPFDGFAVKIDGENKVNNNAGNMNQIPNCDCRMGETMFDGNNYLIWGGMWEHGGGTWEINNTYTLGETNPYVDVHTEIIAGSDATTLSFGKFIDPDSQGMPGDSSSTDNVLGYGVIPDTNVAFSEATVSRYALGIYTTDTNVTAGINGWSTQADGYDGTTYTDADGNPVKYGNGDDTIGISWTWTGVTTGDILEANYAYIFGPSAFDAAEDAITGGAGGGDTTTTDSWGTLEDVGSATDAAEADAGGADPVITTETVVDTSRPILTASITTHESSVADGVQTIDREKTTTTTTPMKTVTYTDGVETSSAVADSAITSAVTDPGSFTGRMDTGKKIGRAVDLHSLGFADYVAGSRITSDLGDGCSAESRVLGIGGSTTTDDLVTIEGGINRITTSADACSTGDMTTLHMGVGASKALEKFTVRGTINRASQDITYERHIGDFTNQGEYSTSDTWVNVEVEPNTGKIRPVMGIVAGKRSTDAYTETGSIQSAIAHEATDESYRYATLGANFDFDLGTAHISRSTEGTTRIGIGVDHHINEKISFAGDFSRSMSDDAATNSLSVGFKIRF
jgi:hypothetical protein